MFWYKKRGLFSLRECVILCTFLSPVRSIKNKHMAVMQNAWCDSSFSTLELIDGQIRCEDSFFIPISERFTSLIKPIKRFFDIGWWEIRDSVIIVNDILEPRQCLEGMCPYVVVWFIELCRHEWCPLWCYVLFHGCFWHKICIRKQTSGQRGFSGTNSSDDEDFRECIEAFYRFHDSAIVFIYLHCFEGKE